MDIPWTMMTRTRRAAMLLCVTTVLAVPAAAQVDQRRAQEYFKDVQAVCEREGKRLWGVSLCGPMVIADARTQTIVTSQPAPEGTRRFLPGMNAPIQWGGATWAAYSWDTLVNAPPLHAREILLHELFHGIVQLKLGLAASEVLNEHLDVMDGRYWLRLECRALARALRESGGQRNMAVRDALAFRQARRMRYQGSAEKERALEINEGVASYTGVAAAAESTAGAVMRGIEILPTACQGDDSFVRTFAYWTGPAYGLLLDESSAGWRQRIRNTDDFAVLLAGALTVQPATDVAASASRYGGAEIHAAEELRERSRQDRLAELRRQFVDGPVLVIRGGGGSFNPWAPWSFQTSAPCSSAPIPTTQTLGCFKPKRACCSRARAASDAFRHPHAATTRRSLETVDVHCEARVCDSRRSTTRRLRSRPSAAMSGSVMRKCVPPRRQR